MKVKVGDPVCDGEREPVMVILSDQDRRNIAAMPPEATRYCVYPDELWTPDQVRGWMREGIDGDG